MANASYDEFNKGKYTTPREIPIVKDITQKVEGVAEKVGTMAEKEVVTMIMALVVGLLIAKMID